MSASWFVLQSHPREESRCAEELSRRGLTAFFPLIREYRARRRRYEKAPFFPSYLFVRLDLETELDKARWARGVRRLVSFGGPPVPVPEEVMESLLLRTDAEGLISIDQELAEGDRVRIRTGPFKDLLGTVLRAPTPGGRVTILMDILAGSARVEMGNDQVLAV